jgi:hypothetical protein
MKDTRKWLSSIPFTWVVIAIVVLSCVSLHVVRHGFKLPHIASRPVAEGQEARLVNSGRTVTLCRDIQTFEQVMHLDTEKASDIAQLQHLDETEAIYLLATGTRVRVLQANTRHYLVQILDGAYAGATGYVPAAFVQE